MSGQARRGSGRVVIMVEEEVGECSNCFNRRSDGWGLADGLPRVSRWFGERLSPTTPDSFSRLRTALVPRRRQLSAQQPPPLDGPVRTSPHCRRTCAACCPRTAGASVEERAAAIGRKVAAKATEARRFRPERRSTALLVRTYARHDGRGTSPPGCSGQNRFDLRGRNERWK